MKKRATRTKETLCIQETRKRRCVFRQAESV